MHGTLQKMCSSLNEKHQAQYLLPIGDNSLSLNPLLGKNLTLTHSGNIYCSNCNKKTKKSYSQGHCYVCMQKLASCDMCILKPETCHFSQGTCREPMWGEKNCFVDHYVYLSNTSGIKVGITRHTQLPTRWIDQGATQGLPIFKVKSRLISGLIEIELANFINDKTHWQAMLKGSNGDVNLKEKAEELIPLIDNKLDQISNDLGDDSIEKLDLPTQQIHYPVLEYPSKVKSLNFDKSPIVSGVLQGIKGQYLIFDSGVINIRNFSSYEVTVSTD
jgi:hypothetical protein